jgi:YesN/AraC family two-component response regulator
MYRLLIVDDDSMFLQSLIGHMPWGELGVEIAGIATNGREALSLYRERHPELLLSDIRMPLMDGLNLATAVREIQLDCQIIFMSVYADKEYLKMAIKLQAVDYIEKPVDREELIGAIGRAVKTLNNRPASSDSDIWRFSRTVEDVIQHLLDNFREEITIDFLASQVYLSPNYLSSLFKKETGKTILQFLTEIRIGKSKELLINSYESVQEIARQVGYSDSRHFSKIFQKAVGKTPTAFRRRGL